jgi:hypothetical protein
MCDLEAAATALASLSFGLAFVDQLFGADCVRLRRVRPPGARVYVAAIVPRPAAE